MLQTLPPFLWQGGDLREAIWRDIREGTDEYDWYNKGKDVALAVARGLYFLHRNGVVHRYLSRLYIGHVAATKPAPLRAAVDVPYELFNATGRQAGCHVRTRW